MQHATEPYHASGCSGNELEEPEDKHHERVQSSVELPPGETTLGQETFKPGDAAHDVIEVTPSVLHETLLAVSGGQPGRKWRSHSAFE